MSTGPAAQQAARQYITTQLSGTIEELELVGMTMTPTGRRIGYAVTWDNGTSLAGAVAGGVGLGLVGTLVGIVVGLVSMLIGAPPSLLVVLILLVGGGGAWIGWTVGASQTEDERLTVTIDTNGDVVLINRDLSTGEFSRAIDREYDRQTDQFDDAVRELSKHWLFHKLVDRYLDRNQNN